MLELSTISPSQEVGRTGLEPATREFMTYAQSLVLTGWRPDPACDLHPWRPQRALGRADVCVRSLQAARPTLHALDG